MIWKKGFPKTNGWYLVSRIGVEKSDSVCLAYFDTADDEDGPPEMIAD